MSAIDLNDYVAAGYFITKYATDGYWKSSLMPERVISLSECISKSVTAYWGWNIEKYRQEILDFGIPAEKLPVFKQWSMGVTVDHPNVIVGLDAARQFIAEFLPIQKDVVLLGAALPKDRVDRFLTDHKQRVFDANTQVYENSLHGVNRVLTDKKPLESDGEVLGLEIVGYDLGSIGHSWLCSNLQKDMNELFGIHPNQYGLIETYEEAKKVYDWIAEDEMKGHRAEPEPYYPWLLVRYPLTANPQ